MGEWVIKEQFDTDKHAMVLSEDGSYTAYSSEYQEHYHSTKDGALQESLQKHVIPTFELIEKKCSLHILDICFGLGFNTLATIYYHQKYHYDCKLHIYSPELDLELIDSLQNFTYPKEFDSIKHIILALSKEKVYQDDNLFIEIFVGDAREYVRGFDGVFDIVYQDAFSPKTNPVLWSLEYFAEIKKAMRSEGVLSTYSTALATRLALYENGFNLYIYRTQGCRNSTIASLEEIKSLEKVDMEHKIACNKDVKALRD